MFAAIARGLYRVAQIQNKGPISVLVGSSIVGGYYSYKYRLQQKRLENMDYFYNTKIHWLQKEMKWKEEALRKDIEGLKRELEEKKMQLEVEKAIEKE
jgi:hypothetical protein